MPTLYPDVRDVQWGPGFNDKFDLLRHPIRDQGGNPLMIYRHGGGGMQRDKLICWIADGNGNQQSHYLTQLRRAPTDLHFDIISLETQQARHMGTLASDTHPSTDQYKWSQPVHGRSLYYKEAIKQNQLAIATIKGMCRDCGSDPNRIIFMGTSWGAEIAALTQLMEPVTVGGYDSRVRGSIFHEGMPDFRNRYAYVPRTMTTRGLVYTHATRRLTLTDAFAYFDMSQLENGQAQVTAASTSFRGTVQVASVDPTHDSSSLVKNGDYIVLDGAGMGADATAVTITYRGTAQPIDLTNATWTAATLQLTKTDAFKTYGHTGEFLYVLSGTGVTEGNYEITGQIDKDTITLRTSPAAGTPGDIRALGYGDYEDWSYFGGAFGAHTRAEWDRVPERFKDEISMLWYADTGRWGNTCPILGVYEPTGNHRKPYGFGTGADAHDSAMSADINEASRRNGLGDRLSSMVTAGGWISTDANRDVSSNEVYQWMVRAVTGQIGK